jgi:hypothetical protein
MQIFKILTHDQIFNSNLLLLLCQNFIELTEIDQ